MSAMTLGRTPTHQDLFRSSADYCGEKLSPASIYALLYREGGRLFADETFADLFDNVGRCCVPPRILATIMVLQRTEGLSDREAVERFQYDLRWKYAAGGLDFDHPGFVHTVLVDMRARLRNSEWPDRIFEATLEVAKQAGLVGRKRVIDSTALYDAVATQDTVTLIRSAIRSLLRVADESLAAELRTVLKRDDDYVAFGKPACDWEDKQAREALVDALARDAHAALLKLDGRRLAAPLKEAATLVATVVGQDLEQCEDGMFRIARRVAPDRVISTVDPQARHGHKTAARSFDGYKGHIAVDPDSEIITQTEVTPGNSGDAEVTDKLLADVLSREPEDNKAVGVEAYGDASYGTAENVEKLEASGIEANVKVQAPSARKGRYSKEHFEIDSENKTVRCPAGHVVLISASKDGGGAALFGGRCTDCSRRDQCTASKDGRTITVHPRESTLKKARDHQKSAEWKAKYRSTRPKVERKLGHMMSRRHGGRRARVRGCVRVRQDFVLLGAAINLKRLAALGVYHTAAGWSC
jgi:transposase